MSLQCAEPMLEWQLVLEDRIWPRCVLCSALASGLLTCPWSCWCIITLYFHWAGLVTGCTGQQWCAEAREWPWQRVTMGGSSLWAQDAQISVSSTLSFQYMARVPNIWKSQLDAGKSKVRSDVTCLPHRIDHYCSICDVQTLAMLCCAFGSKFDPQIMAPTPSTSSSSTSVNRSSSEYQFHNNTFSMVSAEGIIQSAQFISWNARCWSSFE